MSYSTIFIHNLFVSNNYRKETFKEESFDDGDDLYDAAIQPSGAVEKRESVDSNIMTTSAVNTRPIETNSPSLTNISSGSGSRRFQFYIGNLTWWATDEDITVSSSTIHSLAL